MAPSALSVESPPVDISTKDLKSGKATESNHAKSVEEKTPLQAISHGDLVMPGICNPYSIPYGGLYDMISCDCCPQHGILWTYQNESGSDNLQAFLNSQALKSTVATSSSTLQ